MTKEKEKELAELFRELDARRAFLAQMKNDIKLAKEEFANAEKRLFFALSSLMSEE